MKQLVVIQVILFIDVYPTVVERTIGFILENGHSDV